MSKTYPIEFSPLYRMRNRRKLARILKLDEKYFKQNHTYKYNHFSEPKSNGIGTRNFMVPEKELKRQPLNSPARYILEAPGAHSR